MSKKRLHATPLLNVTGENELAGQASLFFGLLPGRFLVPMHKMTFSSAHRAVNPDEYQADQPFSAELRHALRAPVQVGTGAQAVGNLVVPLLHDQIEELEHIRNMDG